MFDPRRLRYSIVVLALVLATTPLHAQEEAPPAGEPASIEVTPGEITIEVGSTAQLSAIVRDADGNELAESPVLYFSRARRQLEVNPAGFVQAHGPGQFQIIAMAPGDPDASFFSAQEAPRTTITVNVPVPPVTSVEFTGLPSRYYADTVLRPDYEIIDESGARLREDLEASPSST